MPDEGEVCKTDGHLWFTAEYLAWWLKDSPVPTALATRGSPLDPAPGAIGQPGTQIVLGAQDLDNKLRQGGRFTAGLWLDADSDWGLEGDYFFLARRTIDRSVASPGAADGQFLAVPFFNVTTALEDTADFPGSLPGMNTLAISSRLQGADANVVCNLCRGDCWRLDGLIGFRFMDLAENLAFTTHTEGGAGFLFDSLDQFHADNRYYGGQVGARFEYYLGALFLRATGKAALGGMNQRVEIAGYTTTNLVTGGALETYPGGVFAQPSNSGDHTRIRRAFVSEADVQVGCRLTDWAAIFVGWSYLMADKVVRPGNHVDRSLNPTRTAVAAARGIEAQGPKRPEFDFVESAFWAQGISGGMEIRY